MTLKRVTTKAFTVMEVMVSMVLITFVSAASWLTIHSVNQSKQINNAHLLGENLLIQSQEEVYKYAQSNFSNLQNCNFTPANPCGFLNIKDVSKFPQYSGFNRNVTITSLPAENLKQANFQITWNELNGAKELDASAFYAPPKWNLPGNITGIVRDSSTTVILGGVSVIAQEINIGVGTTSPTTATSNTSATNSTTTSQASTFPSTIDGKASNYTFADPKTGQFTLSPGTWNLTATKAGYAPYTYPTNITFGSGGEARADDILMDPLPANATINVTFNLSGFPIGLGGPNAQLHLYQDGADVTASVTPPSPVSNTNNVTFTIPFTDNNKQCFTVATTSAWRANFVGGFTCTGLNGQVFNYQADGWSSAVASQGLACNTANWAGTGTAGAAPDTICVNPGDKIKVSVPLVDIPFKTFLVAVKDSNSPPLSEQVTLNVYWHNGDLYRTYSVPNNSSNNDVTFPDEQDLFPSTSSYYAILTDQYNVPQVQCCSQDSSASKSANNLVGPIDDGTPNSSPYTVNVNTSPIGALTCGNANGNIIDPTTNAGVGGATVNLTTSSGLSQSTGGIGNYSFQCPDTETGYLVAAGGASMSVSQINYYPLVSGGNQYYNPITVAPISGDTSNLLPNGPPGTIFLWPKHVGTISGTVMDAGSGTPIAGLTVIIKPDNNIQLQNDVPPAFLDTDGIYTLMAVTASDGTFSFPDVPETWPPTAGIGDPILKQTTMQYTLSVQASALYPAYPASRFTLDPSGKNFSIKLEREGGL